MMGDPTENTETSPLLDHNTQSTFAYPPQSGTQSTPEVQIRKSRRFITVEPILIGYLFFGFPISTILSQYAVDRIGEDRGGNYSKANFSSCDNISKDDPQFQFMESVEAEATYFLLNMEIISGCLAAVVAVLLGGYSDKAGRRYAICLPLIGNFLKIALAAVTIRLHLPMEVLYAGAALDGLSGYYGTVLLGCFAYIADITTHEQRQFRIAVLEMCMILPMAVSFTLVGYLIQVTNGYFYPAVIFGGGMFLIMVYALFFLSETVVRDPDAKFFSLSHMVPAYNLFIKNDQSNKQCTLRLLLLALLFVMMPSMAGVDTLFQLNFPLCWNSLLIGIQNGVDIVVTSVGGLIGAKFFIRCMAEPFIALISGIFSVARLVYKGFIRTTAMMFLVSCFSPFNFLFTPTVRSIMSKEVSQEEHGALFSGIAVVETMCMVLGNIMFKPIYAETAPIWAGMVYFVEAGFFVIANLVLLGYICRTKQEESHTYSVRVEAQRRGLEN